MSFIFIEFSADRLKAPDFNKTNRNTQLRNGKLTLLSKFEASTDAFQKLVATILVL